MHTYGYSDKKEPIAKRLNRIEGQVRGINAMVQKDTYCIDILTQIAAAQSALEQVAMELVAEHTRHCLVNDDIGPSKDEKIAELMAAIRRLR